MQSQSMNKSRHSALAVLIIIYFFWGFVAASNDILTSHFKDIFHLKQYRAQLVEFAFYIAYFSGSLIYFAFTMLKGDILNRFGYKKGLIAGLLISATGALCFIPAANLNSYPLLLISLFIVGLGFTLQQIVANPYVIALGDPSTGSHRLNLTGGGNSFGTTIGPVLLSFALYGSIKSSVAVQSSVDSIKVPAIILCCMLLLSVAVLSFSKLPSVTREEHTEKNLGALRYPQLVLGMIAIFFYVGVEVTIGSNLNVLLKLKEIKDIPGSQISTFVSLYWGGLMIGRWRGAISVFNLTPLKRKVLMIVVPLAGFAVICCVNLIRGSDITDYIFYLPFLALAIIAFFLGQEKPAKTLLLFSSIAICLILMGLISMGDLALFSFVSAGLFCSVMWPCIFTLATTGLGKYTNQGSSLLIMMILGGAVIPLIQGRLVDGVPLFGLYIFPKLGAHYSYIVPVFCFGYLAFYGWRVKHIFRKQGLTADAIISE